MTVLTDDIRFERVTTAVGAVVHGVELGPVYSATTEERVRWGLHEFGVLFFEFDHLIDADEFFAFSKLFGEPEQGYRLSTRGGKSGAVLDSDLAPMKEVRINCWHSDGTCFECPPQMAMLTPVELPEVGGDTMWASMYAAWEGLSSHHQRLL
jgi:taurine dioxygenase